MILRGLARGSLWNRRAGALAVSALWGAASIACPRPPPAGYLTPPPDGTTVTCPVTGARCVKGPETPAAIRSMRTFYFCTPEAARRFEATWHRDVGGG